MCVTTARQASPARSLLTWLRAVVFSVCVGAVATLGWYEWSLRSRMLAETETEAMAPVTYYLQHAQDTFEMADALLLGLASRLRGMPRAPYMVWSVNDTLAEQLRLSNRIRSVAS